MITWWGGLSALAQTFYAAAAFFSVLFLWQFVSAMSGLGGDGHVGDAPGVDAHDISHSPAEVQHDLTSDAQGLDTFRLLSVRSILAFGLLFSWAGALYLGEGIAVGAALGRATLWGLAGMLVVAAFFWLLPRLTEEGTAQLSSAIGQVGEVYIVIPAGGLGQVRVLVGDQVRFIKARSADGSAIAVGQQVRVVGVSDGATLLVQKVI